MFKDPGFCDGDKNYEQIIFTVEVRSSVEAILYGCSLLTGKDVQIIIYDTETYYLGGNKFRKEGINRNMNWTFCKCDELIEVMNKCLNGDEIFYNNRLVLLMIVIGVAFLVFLAWINGTLIEQ